MKLIVFFLPQCVFQNIYDRFEDNLVFHDKKTLSQNIIQEIFWFCSIYKYFANISGLCSPLGTLLKSLK